MNKKIISQPTEIRYTALFVKDIDSLLSKFPQKHKRVFAHHSTIEFKPENLCGIEIGKEHKLKIIGHAYDEFGDDLLVENIKSNNKHPHITISRDVNAPALYSNILFEKSIIIEYFKNEYIDVVEGFSDGLKVFTDFKEVLKDEGFPFVYEWTDEAGNKYKEHAHVGKVSFFVISGEVVFSGGINKKVSAGERFDVPVRISHTAKVGPDGCRYIVGQEIEDDA